MQHGDSLLGRLFPFHGRGNDPRLNPKSEIRNPKRSAEFIPRVNFEEYRIRTEASLSYNLWRYVYLNLSVHDSHDTLPAAGASANELLVHPALGMKF